MALAHALDTPVSGAERDAELARLDARLKALTTVIEDAILERHQTRKQITALRMRVAPPGPDTCSEPSTTRGT